MDETTFLAFNPRGVSVQAYIHITHFRVLVYPEREGMAHEVEVDICGKLSERNSKAVGAALGVKYFRVLSAEVRRFAWKADALEVLESGLGDIRPAPSRD